MRDQKEPVFGIVELDQRRPQQRPPLQVEGTPGVLSDATHGFRFALCLAEFAQVKNGQCDFRGRLNDR